MLEADNMEIEKENLGDFHNCNGENSFSGIELKVPLLVRTVCFA